MFPEPILKTTSDEIIVLEDDLQTRTLVRKSLSRLGYRVRAVESAEEAYQLAKKRRTRSYILDIKMGPDRDQEGLTALERIKDLSEDIFVGILSAYPKRYREMARRLGVNVFQEKTAHPEQDVYGIILKMLLHKKRLDESNIRTLRDLLGIDCALSPTGELPATDVNYSAYHALKSDPRWLEKHIGKYVAFVAGKQIMKDTDRSRLLLRLREKYSEQPVFVTQVEESEAVVDIPTPLFIAD
jgi:CheY-like chemotaxis protein